MISPKLGFEQAQNRLAMRFLTHGAGGNAASSPLAAAESRIVAPSFSSPIRSSALRGFRRARGARREEGQPDRWLLHHHETALFQVRRRPLRGNLRHNVI